MATTSKKNQETNVLDEALKACKKTFAYSFFFAFIANLLMLALPIYTLQVLDRVVSTGSLETLALLSAVTIAALVCYGIIQMIRSFIMVRISEWLEDKLACNFLKNIIDVSAITSAPAGSQSLRDFNSIKSFLTGPGLNALFDAPWSLIYILVIAAIHPVNGMIAFIGAALLIALGIINEVATKQPLDEANEKNIQNTKQVDLASRNAEVMEAMGMTGNIIKRWQRLNQETINKQSIASERSAVLTGLTRILRMVLQIVIVGVGAYFMLNNEISVGGIIAGSILVGRALAPFEGAIASWKQMVTARQSYHRLKESLLNQPPRKESMSIPAPKGALTVEGILFAPHGAQKPIIRGVNFSLQPGEILGMIGPSAAGKSTMAKLIMGVWKPQSGAVRLDGADVFSWNREEFGQYTGYLPQDVELFDGTVKENIARMELPETIDAEKVVEAAQLAGVHDMILRLPNGYETQIGMGGSNLSAGQRQRIGLARAFYGSPKLVVLDEPNANLDQEGENALQKALVQAKEKGITTIVIAHRPTTLAAVDKIAIIKDGTLAGFGPRDEILAKLSQTTKPAGQPANTGNVAPMPALKPKPAN